MSPRKALEQAQLREQALERQFKELTARIEEALRARDVEAARPDAEYARRDEEHAALMTRALHESKVAHGAEMRARVTAHQQHTAALEARS